MDALDIEAATRRPRARHRGIALGLLAGLLALPGGCGGGGGADPVSPPSITIRSSRGSGIPGTEFVLSAHNLTPEREVSSWSWADDLGRTATGDTWPLTFDAPGLHRVEVTATGAGGSRTAQVALQVFDAGGAAPTLFGVTLAAMPGDVDGDGAVRLADAVALRRHVARLERLPTLPRFPAADVDQDGEVTDTDADLLAEAVAIGQVLPDRLLPAHGGPGVGVRLISPHLLDPAADVRLRVGPTSVVTPFRPRPGYATFVVPMDVAGHDLGAVPSVKIPVVLLVDGVEKASYAFDLETPADFGGDPRTEIAELFESFAPLLHEARTAIELASSGVGIGARQAVLLLAEVDWASEHLGTAPNGVRRALASMSPEELRAVSLAFRSNGAVDLLATVRSLLTPMASGARAAYRGDSLADLICRVGQLGDAMQKWNDRLGYVCAALDVAAMVGWLFLGPADAILAVVAKACSSIQGSVGLSLLALNFLPHLLGNDLLVVPETSNLAPGEATPVRVQVRFTRGDLDGACNLAGSKLSEYLVQRFLRLLIRAVALPDIAAEFSLSIANIGKVEKRLAELVGGALNEVLGATGMDTLLTDCLQQLCAWIAGNGEVLTIDPNGVLGTAAPDTVGTLTLPAPGSELPATFTCSAQTSSGSPAWAVLLAQRDFCGRGFSGQATITCGAEQDVTFTIGDNGNLLDDIFELKVGGASVIAPGAPVRSASATLKLVPGDYELLLIGHAAPDGVGTYFLSVVGGRIVSGPALSGSDLTAGAVFTYTLRVESN